MLPVLLEAKPMTRGGKRRGAGAPKGNKNAYRNGTATSNLRLQLAWQSLTPEQQEQWGPIVKAAGAAFDVSWLAEVTATSDKIRLIHGGQEEPSRAPASRQSHTHTQTHNQTIKGQALLREREMDVLTALRGWGFFNADIFVAVHLPALDRIEEVIAEMRAKEDDSPAELAGLTSKAATVRSDIHEALLIRVGSMRQCPYCGKKVAIVVRLVDETEQKTS